MDTDKSVRATTANRLYVTFLKTRDLLFAKMAVKIWKEIGYPRELIREEISDAHKYFENNQNKES